MEYYEVRLFKADGAVSIVMVTTAASERDAELQAVAMLKGEIVRVEIWSEGVLLLRLCQYSRRAKAATIGKIQRVISKCGRTKRAVHFWIFFGCTRTPLLLARPCAIAGSS